MVFLWADHSLASLKPARVTALIGASLSVVTSGVDPVLAALIKVLTAQSAKITTALDCSRNFVLTKLLVY